MPTKAPETKKKSALRRGCSREMDAEVPTPKRLRMVRRMCRVRFRVVGRRVWGREDDETEVSPQDLAAKAVEELKESGRKSLAKQKAKTKLKGKSK